MRISGSHYKTVWFEGNELKLIDQPLLPHEFRIATINDFRVAAEAIKTMVVRGAPAIGATAAFAIALAALQGEDIDEAAQVLRKAQRQAQA